MEQWEQATPAEMQSEMRVATCWECGQELECFEYIVCCTGTVFHVCPICREKAQEADVPAPVGGNAPSSLG